MTAFRADSAQLRRGELSADAYYAKFCALFATPSARGQPPLLRAQGLGWATERASRARFA